MISPALMVPLPINEFRNKRATNVPRKSIFLLFVSFLTVSITPFVYKPDSLRDMPIFMILCKSSFQNTNVAVPDPMFYLFIYLSFLLFE